MSDKKKSTKFYKVLVLGDSGVGKTALIQRFYNNKFSQQFRSTIGADFCKKDVMIDGKRISLQIWDTAGQERYYSLSYAYYRGTDCCALVYDITNPDSFENLMRWKDDFLKNVNPLEPHTFPFVILGNKSDKDNEDERKVQNIKA